MSLIAGDRVLLTSQSNRKQNGPWIIVAAGTWTRPPDFAGGMVFTTGGLLVAALDIIEAQPA